MTKIYIDNEITGKSHTVESPLSRKEILPGLSAIERDLREANRNSRLKVCVHITGRRIGIRFYAESEADAKQLRALFPKLRRLSRWLDKAERYQAREVFR